MALRDAPRTRSQRKRAREEEQEEEEEERCRLCLGGEEDGPLLQLCACRGSAKLVHRHCLEKWRCTSDKEDAAYRCGECKDHYRDALSLELLRARLQAERARGQAKPFTFHTLALELYDQGKYDEAEPLYKESLTIKKKVLGEEHPSVATGLNNLAELLSDQVRTFLTNPRCLFFVLWSAFPCC